MKMSAQIATALVVFLLPALSQPALAQDPRTAFESAQNALLKKDYASAEKGFQEVLRLDPHSASAYSNLGVVYMRTQRFDSAIRALQEAKKLAPAVRAIDLNLGLAYYHKQEFAKAIPEFSQALQSQADNYQARYLLGMSCFMEDEY